MDTSRTYQADIATRAGVWLGRLWRSMRQRQPHSVAAKISLGLVKLVLVLMVAYVAFWMALMVVIAWIAATLVRAGQADDEQPVFEPTDPHDHRKSLFYDPIAYTDDPDPRWDDE